MERKRREGKGGEGRGGKGVILRVNFDTSAHTKGDCHNSIIIIHITHIVADKQNSPCCCKILVQR